MESEYLLGTSGLLTTHGEQDMCIPVPTMLAECALSTCFEFGNSQVQSEKCQGISDTVQSVISLPNSFCSTDRNPWQDM
jgi:hypothetical protein